MTLDGTIYPSQHFPFDAAFVCQAVNFWTLLRISSLPMLLSDGCTIRLDVYDAVGEARIITRHVVCVSYNRSESELIALDIQHAMGMRHIVM